MNNPFNLTDEQLYEIERKHTQYECFDLNGETHSGLAITSNLKTILADAERMAKENAQSAFTADWDNVPPEYRFAAADGSGRIYFYTKSVVPLLASPVWYIPEPDGNWIMRGFCQAVADGKIDWRTTLRQRPPTHA